MLGILFVTVVVIYLVSLYFRRPKPGINPFATDKRSPPKPRVTLESDREKVLKQRFRPSKVPEGLDAIVIGSGIGGTSVAALLSQAGKKVLVLEQHDQAGGCCHTFIDKGYEFDTGIHYIGGMAQFADNRILCDQVTAGQLNWIEMDKIHDLVRLGDEKQYPIVSPMKDFQAVLEEKFPDDKEAIREFVRLSWTWRKAMNAFFIYKMIPKWLAKFLVATGLYRLTTNFFTMSQTSISEAVDKLTKNADLKAVLCYIFGDYGVFPKDVSCTLHAAFLLHYQDKAFYPSGGPSEITFHIIPEIEKGGGKVFVNALVSKILMDNGRACGVQVVSKSGTETSIYAPLIISDAGVINTFTKLLPREIAQKSDKSTCLLITVSKYDWFSQWAEARVKDRGAEYEGLKKAIAHLMWQRCLKFYPQLEDKVEYFDVGSPLSNNYYIAAQKGEVYGLDHNMKRLEPDVCVKLRAETDVPGLVLTGQDIMTAGFSSALFGGLMSASHILHRNLYSDLQKLKKELKKKG